MLCIPILEEVIETSIPKVHTNSQYLKQEEHLARNNKDYQSLYYTYDQNNRIVKINTEYHEGENITTIIDYNSGGKKAKKTIRGSHWWQTTKYEYDNNFNMIAQQYTDGYGQEIITTRRFDKDKRVLQENKEENGRISAQRAYEYNDEKMMSVERYEDSVGERYEIVTYRNKLGLVIGKEKKSYPVEGVASSYWEDEIYNENST